MSTAVFNLQLNQPLVASLNKNILNTLRITAYFIINACLVSLDVWASDKWGSSVDNVRLYLSRPNKKSDGEHHLLSNSI